jgi:predicted phosphohydrolase
LHLEFKENKAFLAQHPLALDCDILILAGDILVLGQLEQHREYLEQLSVAVPHTYIIPGNHEYYHFDMKGHTGAFKEDILPNVHLLNNRSVVHGNTRFIFSTLGSHIGVKNQIEIESRLNDFKLIKVDGQPLNVDMYNKLHSQHLHFLQQEIANATEENLIVATHHAPTYKNYPPKYLNDSLNDAFVVELHDFIASTNVDYWIYGHTHYNTSPYKIGNTTMLTNQLCYVCYNEHHDFVNLPSITIAE